MRQHFWLRNLREDLKLLEEEAPMDYCVEFDEIKAIFEYCDKHIKPLEKVRFRGGNGQIIIQLGTRIKEMFRQHGYVQEDMEPRPENSQILRKITVFLIMNTDFTCQFNMKDGTLLCHVYEVMPVMQKFLLVALIWELKLDQFFYEALCYMPCWFTVQFFGAAGDSLKFIKDPYEILKKVENLLHAIFMSITRSDYYNMEATQQKIMLGRLYDLSLNIMRQFYTPDAEKFVDFTRLQKNRYQGLAIKHLLEIIMSSFAICDNPNDYVEPYFDFAVYDIHESSNKMEPKPEEKSPTVKEYQEKFLLILLNSLDNHLFEVTLKIFMYWADVTVETQESLQKYIGEHLFDLQQRLKQDEVFEKHSVLKTLIPLCLERKSEEALAHSATLGELLRKLDEEDLPENVKKIWLDELMQRDVALMSDECRETFLENAQLLSMEHCKEILVTLKQLNDEMKDAEDELSVILLATAQHMNEQQLLQLLMLFTEHFNAYSNMFEQPNFHARATLFFNKMVQQFDMVAFLQLCLENGALMWRKFLETALFEENGIVQFCKTVLQTRAYADLYIEPMLKKALAEVGGLIQNPMFPRLICQVYFELYFPENKKKFLQVLVQGHIMQMLEDEQTFIGLLPIVKALNLIAVHRDTETEKPLNFGEVTSPVLMLVAEIMNRVRWNMETYSEMRDTLLRDCVEFVERVNERYLPVSLEMERKWINKTTKTNYDLLTQYYFQKYALPPEQEPLEFHRFVISESLENKDEVKIALFMNLMRCNMQEVEWLMHNEVLLSSISSVMPFICDMVVTSANPNSLLNYKNCVINYSKILEKYLVPQAASDLRKTEKLLFKVLYIIRKLPHCMYEDIFLHLNPLVMAMLLNCAEEITILQSVREFMMEIPDCLAKNVILEKVQHYEQATKEKLEMHVDNK